MVGNSNENMVGAREIRLVGFEGASKFYTEVDSRKNDLISLVHALVFLIEGGN